MTEDILQIPELPMKDWPDDDVDDSREYELTAADGIQSK
jgi:hypothetical protein